MVVDLLHNCFALATCLKDADKKLGKSERELCDRSLKHVFQDKGKGAEELISTLLNQFILFFGLISNDFFEEYQALDPFS